MVECVVVGTVAFDSIKTPFGKAEKTLGGSGTYASIAASLFAKTGLVSIVGKDFPEESMKLLQGKGIDTAGIEKAGGKTFSWKGEYGLDINVAKTLQTDLNVLEKFDPKLPEEYKKAGFLFLGNIDPELQLKVLAQMKKTKLAIADTMNYWIESKREKVLEVVEKADICLMNDAEARQLFKTANLMEAAKEILKRNSQLAIIKKGEHGSLLCTSLGCFTAPAYPLENVVDPTGCGDSFAGALIGFLAKQGKVNEELMRKALIYGSTVASFNAEGIGTERIKAISTDDINKRFEEFKELVRF